MTCPCRWNPAGEHAYISHLRSLLRAGGVAGLISTLSSPKPGAIEGMKVRGDWVALEYSISANASRSLAALRSVIPSGVPSSEPFRAPACASLPLLTPQTKPGSCYRCSGSI